MTNKYRLVHVNHNIPGASFYTTQKEDNTVLPYDEHKQPEYEALVKSYNIKFTDGPIGDAYSEWIGRESIETA